MIHFVNYVMTVSNPWVLYQEKERDIESVGMCGMWGLRETHNEIGENAKRE